MQRKLSNMPSMSALELGKLPPQATDMEEAVLGAIIVEPSTLRDVIDILKPESFYKDVHRIIYKAIISLNDRFEPIDMMTLVEELRRTDELDMVGGHIYIVKLSQAVASGSHIETHAKIIAQKYIQRELIRISHELINAMFDSDAEIEEAISVFDSQKNAILSFTKRDEVHIKKAVNETIDQSIKAYNGLIPNGIPTGFTYFDEFSGGLQPSDLIIIGGEPSNGKTTLGLDMLRNGCRFEKSAIISYEMSVFQLTARLIGMEVDFSSKDIIRGKVNDSLLIKYTAQLHKLTSSDLYISKPKSTSFAQLKVEIRRMFEVYGIKLFMIDYAQLITNKNANESKAERVGEIANELKAISSNLNIATILLSQLARDRNSPRPTIERLKYSGDLEAAADTIIMPYLPFKYGYQTEKINGESVDIGSDAIIVVGKGRNIGTTEFRLKFHQNIPKFGNWISSPDFIPQDYSEPSQAAPW